MVLLSLAPIEMMDTERPCPPFPFLTPLSGAPFHRSVVRCGREDGGGTFNDKVALWPLSGGRRGRGLAAPFFTCTLVAFLLQARSHSQQLTKGAANYATALVWSQYS
jgi:hypothetical protein